MTKLYYRIKTFIGIYRISGLSMKESWEISNRFCEELQPGYFDNV